MKKKTKVTTKNTKKVKNEKLRLCTAIVLLGCMFAGCHNTDKPSQTENNSAAMSEQQNQTDAVTATPGIAPQQTEAVTTTQGIEPLQTEVVTEIPNTSEPVKTAENVVSSKQPSEGENIKHTEQVKSTKQPENSNGKIADYALGFSIQFSEKLSKKIKYTSDLKRKDDDFGIELHYTEFYTTLEKKKQPLFVIYQMNQKMTESEVADINPEMGYLGCSDTATYTIEYTTEPISGLSRESEQEFENLMGEAVGEIANTFQIVK